MTIHAVEFARATRGWRCMIAFRLQTRRQCTREDHVIYDGAEGHGPLSVALAFWRGLRAMRTEARRLRALPGPWPLGPRTRAVLRDPDRQVEENLDGYRDGYQGAPVRVHLDDRKGGDPAEWPADLRIREWPSLADGKGERRTLASTAPPGVT